METASSPLALTQLVLGEGSVDIEEVRDELRTELIMLNVNLKRLDNGLDFSDVLRPLLTDQGPALALIQRLNKQKVRMTRIRDDFLRKEQEHKEQERQEQERKEQERQEQERKEKEQPQAAPEQAASQRKRSRRTFEDPCNQSIQQTAPLPAAAPVKARKKTANGLRGDFVTDLPETIEAIEPHWGPLKRYTPDISQTTYLAVLPPSSRPPLCHPLGPLGAAACRRRRPGGVCCAGICQEGGSG